MYERACWERVWSVTVTAKKSNSRVRVIAEKSKSRVEKE